MSFIVTEIEEKPRDFMLNIFRAYIL